MASQISYPVNVDTQVHFPGLILGGTMGECGIHGFVNFVCWENSERKFYKVCEMCLAQRGLHDDT